MPFTGTHPKAQAHVDTVHTKAPADAIIVNDANLLFSGDFKRTGTDLVISKDDRELVLSDYFKGDKHAPLASADGAYLTGKLIDALTGHVQMAQADGSASIAKIIGHVTKLTGSATAVRNGVSIILNNGDNVYQGDVVQSGSSSTLGITFIDGSVFGLASNAKMVLNEMVYDPNGSNNSSLLSLVHGTITFVAGATAKHGDMKVDTPVATMGIRGTACLVEAEFEVQQQQNPLGPQLAPPVRFQVLVEPDGTVGAIVLLDRVTLAPMANVNQAGTVTTVSGQGTVSFLASAQLSPEVMRLITEVFSQRYTDNANPRSDTHFTDSVIPDNSFPQKFAFADLGTFTILSVTVIDHSNGPGTGPPVAGSHIPGAPGVVTFNEVLAERTLLTGSSLVDTVSGHVSFSDPNPGDSPTVSTAFDHFSLRDAAGHEVTLLTTAQLNAIAAVTVPLVVVQSPGGGNNGAATYTYGVSDHAADFLAEGETLTLTYMARVDNNFALNNEFSFAQFTITITGTNDVPTILVGQTTPTGVVVEDSNVNASGNITTGGTITFNDVDLTDTHTASFVFSSSHASGSLPGFADNTSIGTFALTSVGEVPADGDTSGSVGWTFTVDDSNPIVQSLAEGQTITLVYIVTVSDGHGGTVDQEVTVTVTGASPNHAPTIVGELTTATGDVTEDVDVNGSNQVAADGTIVFQDVDLTDTHTASFVPTSSTSNAHLPGFTDNATYIGTFALAPVSEDNTDAINTGSVGWTFKLDDNDPVLQSLAAGQTITQIYTVTIIDNNGAPVTQDVTVTITGTNDAPTVVADSTTASGGVTEDTNVSGGNIATAGAIGFQDLDLIDTHTATVAPASSTSNVHLPGFTDNSTYIGQFSLTPATVVNGTVVESADTINTASVGWTFTIDDDDPTLQSLAAGQTITQVYAVTIIDNNGAPVTQDVTVTITGTNDAPTVVADSTTASGGVTEDTNVSGGNIATSGTIGFQDLDLIDTHTATVAPASSTSNVHLPGFTDNSTYIGQFSLTPATVVNGTVVESADTINTASVGWTFTLDDDDPTLQSLAAGQTITQVYTVTVYDGHVGGTVTQDVTVTITGTEDAPTITTATTEALTSGAVVEDGKQSTSGAITFQDVDLIDTHSLSQALTGGSASTTLPGFNPATQPLGTLALKLNEDNADTDNTGTVDWTFTIDNALAQQLAAGQVITQTYTVTIDDGHTGGTVTQDITVTITGTNDTPIVATADVTGGVTELVTPVGNLSDSGTIGFTDVDLTDTHSIEPTIVASPGALGTLTASVTTDTTGTGLGGVVTWDYQVAASAVEYLGEGKTKVEHFTITLDDGHGGTVERTVEVTITGTNDASSIVGETNPPTIGVMVVNPVSPTIEPAGQNTNTLGLANESFDGQTSGSVSNNGTGTGNFTSADLGATFTASGHAGIVHGSSSVSAAPFMGPQPGSQDTSNYLSIGADATETITFTTDKNSFGLYWGSVDSYNTIDFYEGDTLVASYTGADIVPLLASGNQGSFTANGYVEFSGLPNFNKVVLGTGGSNAFEIDNISAGSGPVAHATLQGPLSGTLSVHDVDIGDTLTGVVGADATVRYNNSSTLPNGVNVADLIKAGNLTFDSVESDGGTDTLHWNYDPHGANLDFLHAGDVLEITYTAQVSDGHGSYGNQQVTVTLVGTNSQTNVSALTVVDGTSGNDTFNNVGGNTTVLGNGGHDNFVFKPGSGSATIADFDPANDTITFASSMFNHNPANVLLAAHDDGHGNTVIALNATDTITLQHVQASHLTASDFHFV